MHKELSKSLNDVYERGELFFYCNAAGEIGIPGTDPWSRHEPDDLPHSAWELYMNYWTEDSGLMMYVVEYKCEKCMALNVLFDRGYMDDLRVEYDIDVDEDLFWEAVQNIADTYCAATNCETLVGKDTDPDGHEILFIVPASRCSTIRELAGFVTEHIYGDFEQRYKYLLKVRKNNV